MRSRKFTTRDDFDRFVGRFFAPTESRHRMTAAQSRKTAAKAKAFGRCIYDSMAFSVHALSFLDTF